MGFSNFDFLKYHHFFENLIEPAQEAEQAFSVSPALCAAACRRALEQGTHLIYILEDLPKPPRATLGELVAPHAFRDLFDPQVYEEIRYVIYKGNRGIHTTEIIREDEAIRCLVGLHNFLASIEYCYGKELAAKEYDLNLLPAINQREQQELLKKLEEEQKNKDQEIARLLAELEAYKTNQGQEIEKLKIARRALPPQDKVYRPRELSEAEVRKSYIDPDLRAAGWVLGENWLSEYKINGKNIADYVLLGRNGKPIAIVEAKKPSKSAKAGEAQAFRYAGELEKQGEERPILFATNGFDLILWEDEDYPQRQISGFYSPTELEELKRQQQNRRKILPERVASTCQIAGRKYQKGAIEAVGKALNEKRRQALLVMATGSGKTRVSAALVDLLLRQGWVNRVLFLADRIALVKQAQKSFSELPSIKETSQCNLLNTAEAPKERIIFSTYQTMMNRIDQMKNPDGSRVFTPAYFDLIIIDEAHRSIYKKYGAIFEYFDAFRVGLTATPKSEVDINTYRLFGLQDGKPTFAYELDDAIQDQFLVPYQTCQIDLKLVTDGLTYEELTGEEKEHYEELFAEEGVEEPLPTKISGKEFNDRIMNENTVDQVLSYLMEKGIRVQQNELIGKTIIFAQNHNHGAFILDRINANYPHYKGQLAQLIDYQSGDPETWLEKFKDPDQMPQIAVSVDMLDTGIDVPEVVNLVFFKRVFSRTKFAQMIGRGTRLCPNLFGLENHKTHFLIFDPCGNFDFFGDEANGRETKPVASQMEKLFMERAQIVKALQDLDYQREEEQRIRQELLEWLVYKIGELPRDSFQVKRVLPYYDEYCQTEAWQDVTNPMLEELKKYLAPLILPDSDDNPDCRSVDRIFHQLELKKFQGAIKPSDWQRISDFCEDLKGRGSIDAVRRGADEILKVLTPAYQGAATIGDLEKSRKVLRELAPYLTKEGRRILYTKFQDQVTGVREEVAPYGTSSTVKSAYYKEKIEEFVKTHQEDPTLKRLRSNQKLGRGDLVRLSKLLFDELGTKEDYDRIFGNRRLEYVLREYTGLDERAAQKAFQQLSEDESLNRIQRTFIQTLIDHVVKHGMVENLSAEENFRSFANLDEIFSEKQWETLFQGIEKIKPQIEEN